LDVVGLLFWSGDDGEGLGFEMAFFKSSSGKREDCLEGICALARL